METARKRTERKKGALRGECEGYQAFAGSVTNGSKTSNDLPCVPYEINRPHHYHTVVPVPHQESELRKIARFWSCFVETSPNRGGRERKALSPPSYLPVGLSFALVNAVVNMKVLPPPTYILSVILL
jgi:hypothetical protein